jgi:hypothetical protein
MASARISSHLDLISLASLKSFLATASSFETMASVSLASLVFSYTTMTIFWVLSSFSLILLMPQIKEKEESTQKMVIVV